MEGSGQMARYQAGARAQLMDGGGQEAEAETALGCPPPPRRAPADSQPKGLVLLKVTSMGKFHTSACRTSRLFDVIWEIPSSSP